MTPLGLAWLGLAWLGLARLGSAWLGLARLGSARLGSARLGAVRLVRRGRSCSCADNRLHMNRFLRYLKIDLALPLNLPELQSFLLS